MVPHLADLFDTLATLGKGGVVKNQITGRLILLLPVSGRPFLTGGGDLEEAQGDMPQYHPPADTGIVLQAVEHILSHLAILTGDAFAVGVHRFIRAGHYGHQQRQHHPEVISTTLEVLELRKAFAQLQRLEAAVNIFSGDPRGGKVRFQLLNIFYTFVQ
ncbi:hypothetical protein [Proteiniphilum sp.]|uniref:hypothetical protein n=1 Tax=Proteiniphilum sp. TaxID=1926877 RepID=UPI00331B5BDA